MKKIDVHADDYGLTLNTSKEMLEGINAGKLDSISVVPNMSAYDSSYELWKEKLDETKNPAISVHLNFMEGHCCSNPAKLDYLVDASGLFNISWGTLVKYNYNYFIRKQVKEQLKLEIAAQLSKVIKSYALLNERKLRVDSHQHTHMIPIVMEALIEVINEKNYPTEYIRISKEPWWVYLKYPKFYTSYRPINMVKVMILNWYAIKDEKMLVKYNISSMLLSGVFLSGKMDYVRISRLLPELIKVAEKKQLALEILFHPGTAKKDEVGKEFNHPDANEFYLSPNRHIEYEAMMNLNMMETSQ